MELEYQLFENSMAETTLHRELEVGQGLVYEGLRCILGYALVRTDGDKLDLTRLGVGQGAQGSGIGSALLCEVITMGKPIVLTVLKHNHRAIRLYYRYGFEIVGHLVSDGAWALRREASASIPAPVRAACP